MTDTLDLAAGDSNPVDPQVFAQWVKQAQAKLAAGGTLGPNEIPTGYVVEGNQLVQDTRLGSSLVKGALLTGAAALGGLALPASGAGQTLEQMMNGAASVSGGGVTSGGVAGGVAGGAKGASAVATASGLPDWLKTAQGVGDALSSLSAGRASGRVAEANANQNQNRAAVDLYNSELAAPAKIASNAVRGDILSNAQDVSIDAPSTIPVPKISGGLRPSMFSPETRATGVGLRSNALASAANLKPVIAPVLPELPQAGGFDSFLNGASTISGLSRAVPPGVWGKIGGFVKGLF